MALEVSHTVALTFLTNVTEKNPQHISPIISAYVLSIIGYINGYVLTTLVGVLGVLTNTINICVYVKMGLSETTNISFFSLSISDLLVSTSAVLVQLTYNPPVSVMKLPSGAPISEIGMAACYIMFPCMGCSAWITAILSVERCLCISTPLKVKEIFSRNRTVSLILTMAVYQSVLIILLYSYPGPPYDVASPQKALYFNISFTALTFVCFFIVLITTVLLVVRLMQNLEWRNKAAEHFNKNTWSLKETKAARHFQDNFLHSNQDIKRLTSVRAMMYAELVPFYSEKCFIVIFMIG
ncbi:hypothetical protein RRG08_052240 [Elysia crispata]|uniref:G-protein coupled receptors family 1 profile domain-containing protein n=1 Tax=Elysia crispata TaxID=231223 RepID=A0AAE1AZQ2_9GAST|nr:hypothetical protein RRG08_052240 [Elysia crispata]